ncbi:MAG: tRNA (adenosine(37)-N6)-dimethylallyltransferase MiaA [Pseudomonadota bacterium]
MTAPPVVCVLGPTASGKTALALELHGRGDVDLISVDSAMVYRGLDIGTAKPEPAVLAQHPHALVDIRDPETVYSVADFVADAHRLVAESRALGRVPVLVGGTMLYFKRLFEGLAELPAADAAVRAAIEDEAAREGWPALHAGLKRVDPDAARRIAPHDQQRIQRALEVYRLTGQPITTLQRQSGGPDWPRIDVALVEPDRVDLHARIGDRFDAMMSAGFENEVGTLLARPGVHRALPSLRAVGYRQVAAWLEGECSREQAVADAKTATRRLAKRQYTWLRSMAGLTFMSPHDPALLRRISTQIDGFLSK